MPAVIERTRADAVLGEAIVRLLGRQAQAAAAVVGGGVDWRAAARADLAVYAEHVHGYTPARHHRLWLERIQQLVQGSGAGGGGRRLLFIAPPQHGKSTYLSLVLPCWYLGHYPDHSLLFVSSSDRMARQFGGTVRLTLEGNERHAAAFPDVRCRSDVTRGWSTDSLYLRGTPTAAKDPAYQAVGFGASVLGARAHGLLLDDPLTQQAAQSEVEREAAMRYYDMTLRERLRPDGWAVAIMTRWHEADLAAHLTRQGWEVQAFPALGAYPWGRALWPEWFSESWLLAEQRELGGPIFETLFQGDPTALGGGVFRPDWFHAARLPEQFERHIRPELTRVQYYDLAYSERASADYTAGVTVGIRPGDERLYVLGCWRDRVTEQRLDEAILAQVRVHEPALVGIEEAAYKQAATRDLVRTVQAAAHRANIPVAVVGVKVASDKVVRARLPAARLQAGTLLLDQQAPWYPGLVAECSSFPRGAHDDRVDALSGAVQLAVQSAAVALEDTRPSTYAYGNGQAGRGPLAPRPADDEQDQQAQGWNDLQRDLFQPRFRRPPEQRTRWPFLTPGQQEELARLLGTAAEDGSVDDDGIEGER